MSKFGETVRQLREARQLGLRETAVRVGISPAYLSRIERGKEKPPSPEIIKTIAIQLAADPDVLFRLSSSTDPEILGFILEKPELLALLRFLQEENFSKDELVKLRASARRIRKSGSPAC